VQNYRKGCRFGDFKRCIKKGNKSTPTSNKYQDKFLFKKIKINKKYIYIYIPNTYLHTPTGLFLHHMQKPTVAERAQQLFLVFLKSPKYQACCCFVLDCRNNFTQVWETRSFIPYKVQQHTHVYYTHTHTLSLFLPRVSVPKASMGSINCYTRISVT
jgi:hypothetical protein